MRLDHLELRHYVPLENTGITSVDADFPKEINVIIGTNGSGKTMLMKTMSPVSLPRTIFEKTGSKSHGYRKQVWSHQGHTYTLISDYSKPASPHEFYVDDDPENINVGGTSQYQQELYQTYMGMSPILLQVITNSIKFTELSTTARKAFLMEINPSKIGFVFELQKKTASKLKAVKNNLSRLQDRKLQLEQQLLSDFEISQMKGEVTRLEKLIADLTRYHNTIDHALRFNVQMQYPGEMPDFKRMIKDIDHQIYLCYDVPRNPDMRNKCKTELISSDGVYRGKITVLEQQYQNDAAELQLKQQLLETISDDESRTILESEIFHTEVLLQKYPKTTPPEIWTRDVVANMHHVHPVIESIINFFLYSHVKILSTSRFRYKERRLEYWSTYLFRLNRHIEDLDTDIQTIQARIKLRPNDIPDLGCEQHSCPLFLSFRESFSTAEQQLQNVYQKYNCANRKKRILTDYVEALTAQVQQQFPIRDKLNELAAIATTHPILSKLLKQDGILKTLELVPKHLLVNIEEQLAIIDDYYTRIDLEDKLKSLHSEISRFKEAGDGSRVDLVNYIAKEEKRLHDLSEEISQYYAELKIISEKSNRLSLYESLLSQLDQLSEMIQSYREGYAVNHEHTQLTDMRVTISRLRQDSLTRLGEISHTLRDQDLIKARYTEEVLGEINRLNKEQEILTKTEQGLQEIPKRYIIPFNNLIIEQMNLFLESTWTQDIVINKFESTNDLKTYNFPYEKYGKPQVDIGVASEGEQEFFNLIFGLSVRIVLNLHDYPIFLDETGRTFDERHKSNLIEMLRSLIHEQIISQMFLINHHAVIHEGFSDAEVIVLKEDNIVTPEVYNQNFVTM